MEIFYSLASSSNEEGYCDRPKKVKRSVYIGEQMSFGQKVAAGPFYTPYLLQNWSKSLLSDMFFGVSSVISEVGSPEYSKFSNFKNLFVFDNFSA